MVNYENFSLALLIVGLDVLCRVVSNRGTAMGGGGLESMSPRLLQDHFCKSLKFSSANVSRAWEVSGKVEYFAMSYCSLRSCLTPFSCRLHCTLY